jgi:hypothetical protein
MTGRSWLLEVHVNGVAKRSNAYPPSNRAALEIARTRHPLATSKWLLGAVA